MPPITNFPLLHEGDQRAKLVRMAQYWLTPRNRHGRNFRPGEIDGVFDDQVGLACSRAKWRLGWPSDECHPTFGDQLHSFLVPDSHPNFAPIPRGYQIRRAMRTMKKNPFRKPAASAPWPFFSRAIGRINGCPYQGTHTRGNWESDRAVDLNVEYGTAIISLWDGWIGSDAEGYGPIESDEDVLAGERFHLHRADGGAEAYYAHCSAILVRPGQTVEKGQVLARSGSAAGVPHLHLGTTPMRPDDLLDIEACE